MDFWASLEHQLKYKQEIPNQQEIVRQLQVCAETISATDEKTQNLRKQIEAMADTPMEDELLMENSAVLI